MVKSELINTLSVLFPEIAHKDTEQSVELIIQKITDTLVDGGRVEVRDFGTFNTAVRLPRKGRNPKTGESVDVPAKRAIKFKSGRGMNFRINLDDELNNKLAA